MEILNAIIAVFMAIGEWFVEAVTTIMPLFYVAESGLTLIGVLSVTGLGISIIFLLVNTIKDFLHFR